MLSFFKKISIWFITILFSISVLLVVFDLSQGFVDKQKYLNKVFRGYYLPRIRVDRPVQNEKVNGLLNVSGRASGVWFDEEDSFVVRIKDQNGDVLKEGKAFKIETLDLEDDPPTFDFSGKIPFTDPESDSGYVEFERPSRDSTESGYPLSFRLDIRFR